MSNTIADMIRGKIAELKAEIATAERALAAVSDSPSLYAPKPHAKTADSGNGKKQTIPGIISALLTERGAMPLADILEGVRAAGRDIPAQSISSALQAMKVRGEVKRDGRLWKKVKGR